MKQSGGQKKLVENGNIRFGLYSTPVEEINHQDYILTDPFGKKRGSLRRKSLFNQFEFLGAVSEKLIFGCAIVDLKLLSSAFVTFYDPEKKKFLAYSFKQPFASGTNLSLRPESGRAEFKKGKNHFIIEAEKGTRRLHARLENGSSIEAEFDDGKKVEPLRICTRAGAGWVYVRKTAAVSVQGKVECELGTFDLKKIGALGHNDWSAGYMRRDTFWNWAALMGKLKDGKTVGLNVSCGVNETSFTENCIWLNGTFHKVDMVDFVYDRFDVMKKWTIRSFDGNVDLEFHPETRHSENVNVLALASNFSQMIGRFYGTLRAGRTKIQIDGLPGYAEDHFARW